MISAFLIRPIRQQCTPRASQILARMFRSAMCLRSRRSQSRHRWRLEAANSSFTGIDFVPNSFAVGPVQRGAALYSLEGDFGFSPPNATAPAPEVGHEVKLINFSNVGEPLVLKIMNFARNVTGDQAFIRTPLKAKRLSIVRSTSDSGPTVALGSQTTVRCETTEQTPTS